MRTDSELRSEFRSALEAVTPAAPWLTHTVKKGLATTLSARRADRAPLQLRYGLNVVAVLVLIALAVAAVGVYLTFHHAVVPASHPGVGRVFFPTKMVDASTGWSWVDPASLQRGLEGSGLWRTTDGGANWTDVSPPSFPDRLTPHMDTSFVLDATHAWVAESGAGAAYGASLYTATFRTTDGGKTWDEGASIEGVSPKLFFIDQDHGWLLLPPQGSSATDSTATLYSTNDAGLHWSFTSSAPWTEWPASSGPPATITFSSLTTGWMSGEKLMVTHDGGGTWHVQPLPVTLDASGGMTPPRFFDPQHGQIFAWASLESPVVLLVTSDGGSTWVAHSMPGEAPLQVAVDFVDANHGWLIAGTTAEWVAVPAVPLPLYRTDDGGLTWVRVPTNVLWRYPEASGGTIDILDFVDRNNGFAVRRNLNNYGTQWLKTTDGGRTWTVVVAAPKTPA